MNMEATAGDRAKRKRLDTVIRKIKKEKPPEEVVVLGEWNESGPAMRQTAAGSFKTRDRCTGNDSISTSECEQDG